MDGDTYTIHKSATVSTAITILQLQAPTAKAIQIIRAWVTQSSIATSAAGDQISIALLRKTAAATVTAAIAGDLDNANPSGAASGVQLGTANTGYSASAEGTDGAYFDDWGFNVLSGYLWLPVPEEREMVAAGGLVAIKFTTAPPSGIYRFGVKWIEIG